MHTLIIQYENLDFHTTHVGFVPFDNHLAVVHGVVLDTKFNAIKQTDFSYDENPELRAVSDGIGWDLVELLTLLEGYETAPEGEDTANITFKGVAVLKEPETAAACNPAN